MEKQRYLGDGVYASFDGSQIWLQTMEGNRIALEPEVMQALIGFAAEHMPGAVTKAGGTHALR